MVELLTPEADLRSLAELCSRARYENAEADGVDPHSSLEHLPTPDELSAAFRQADLAAVARSPSGELAGYGLVWSWVEADATSVHLLDPWAVPGPDRSAVEAELFASLEAAVRADVGPDRDAVLGANSRATEPARRNLLSELGFRWSFDMVEMQASSERRRPARWPPGVTSRTVRPDDAPAIAALAARAWAGRPYVTTPALTDVQRWLAEADAELYLLAEHGTHLVGLASATIRPRCAEIDDVQVDPAWWRRGVATALLDELVPQLAGRTSRPIRLHTEGHDPAGARSLYERLGFTVVTTYHRFRKPLRRTAPTTG